MRIIQFFRQVFRRSDLHAGTTSACGMTTHGNSAGERQNDQFKSVRVAGADVLSPLERYRRAFNEAHERAGRLGLEVTAVPFSNTCYLADPDRLAHAGSLLGRYLHDKGLEVTDLAAQCWRVNMSVTSLLERYFGTPLTLTFGAIETSPGVIRFQMSETELASLMKDGLDFASPSVNLHAWLTFPSMEILDITYLTSYAVVNNIPDLLGLVVSGQHGDLSVKAYAYHPLVIGRDFVKKSGLNRVAIKVDYV